MRRGGSGSGAMPNMPPPPPPPPPTPSQTPPPRHDQSTGFPHHDDDTDYTLRVSSLDELKSAILCNMSVVGHMSVRRVACGLLNILPPNQYKFKIFRLCSDEHVCAMFALHRGTSHEK
ncbi:hypothetical protein PIB30_042731 [Stylosanthes scabra]|uniref:Uncharacterized protein n=1 Tax=Stylosanthes scabra TaxID=79078 RepID=A0ABU6QER8_9FABA|nr:hypothetical protein [Stylosanthes scabra]